MSSTDIDIMVLIAAFNEAPVIGDVVAGCRKWRLPVVVVDDGSSDSTVEEAERAGAQVIAHSENHGKGKALATGFDYASRNGFEAVVTLDADGQHDPDQIGLFLDEYRRNGADVIVGTRMRDVRRMPWIRRFTNRASSFVISRITGCRIQIVNAVLDLSRCARGAGQISRERDSTPNPRFFWKLPVERLS